MRVSCAVPVELASDSLMMKIAALGLEPIITSQIIRVVYEGHDHLVGAAIVEMFMREADHEVTVDFTDEREELSRRARKEKKRKGKRT